MYNVSGRMALAIMFLYLGFSDQFKLFLSHLPCHLISSWDIFLSAFFSFFFFPLNIPFIAKFCFSRHVQEIVTCPFFFFFVSYHFNKFPLFLIFSEDLRLVFLTVQGICCIFLHIHKYANVPVLRFELRRPFISPIEPPSPVY